MNMDALLWMFLPLFVAAGSALLTAFIMQARMDVAIARERQSLAEARAIIDSHRTALEERVRATEESARRRALDEFMREFRVEERSYLREAHSLHAGRKLMVMQERLYFRNIPLSDWVEHEMLLEEGLDSRQAVNKCSVFSAPAVTGDTRTTLSKLLEGSAASVLAGTGMV